MRRSRRRQRRCVRIASSRQYNVPAACTAYSMLPARATSSRRPQRDLTRSASRHDDRQMDDKPAQGRARGDHRHRLAAAAARPRQPTRTASAASTAPASCRRPSDPDLVERAPRGQGRPRRPGVRARPPLPARRGHPVRRRHRRLVQARPRGGRPARGRVHRLLRRALHGRVGRHPDLARASRSCCPTWPPAARWPTWPTYQQVEECWDVLEDAGVADVTRARSPT